MEVWKVKSKGRLQRIIVMLLGLGMIGLSSIVGFRIIGWDVKGILLITSIIWIPVVLVALKRVLASKIPIELLLDSELKLCSIRYSKKLYIECPYDTLAFSVSDEKKNYCVLTLFQTYVGTREQTVFNETTKIIGFRWSMSWKVSTVLDIVDQLLNDGIEETHARKKGWPLWELLISR